MQHAHTSVSLHVCKSEGTRRTCASMTISLTLSCRSSSMRAACFHPPPDDRIVFAPVETTHERFSSKPQERTLRRHFKENLAGSNRKQVILAVTTCFHKLGAQFRACYLGRSLDATRFSRKGCVPPPRARCFHRGKTKTTTYFALAQHACRETRHKKLVLYRYAPNRRMLI